MGPGLVPEALVRSSSRCSTSGSAAARISSAASVTSKRVRLEERNVEEETPWAMVMLISRSGLAIACFAASIERLSNRPIPMRADPASS